MEHCQNMSTQSLISTYHGQLVDDLHTVDGSEILHQGGTKQYTTPLNRPGHLSIDWFRIPSINHFNAKGADSMRP